MDLAAALAQARGRELTVYMLPGTYSGKTAFSGNVKLANYQGGSVTVRNSVFLGKGGLFADGIAFKNTSFRIKGGIEARRSFFDSCDVQADRIALKNTALRDNRLSGKTALHNSLVCGKGNKWDQAGMISENNCFTSPEALKDFQARVKEAHRSFHRNVKLTAFAETPADSSLVCGGLDCSTIGWKSTPVKQQSVVIEELKAKAVSKDGVMVSWRTPRHYCNVSVRCYSLSERRESASVSFAQGSLRETEGQVLLQNFRPGKEYNINLYFYPLDGQKSIHRQIKFRMP